MGLIRKSYADNNNYRVNISSKEELIETFLLSIDCHLTTIYHTEKDKLSFKKYDGGFLTSNFLNNDKTCFDWWEEEVDFKLIDVDLKKFRLPLFSLDSHDHHDLFTIMNRALKVNKDTTSDVYATCWSNPNKSRKRNKLNPMVNLDFATFQNDEKWYQMDADIFIDYKDRDFVMLHQNQLYKKEALDRVKDAEEWPTKKDGEILINSIGHHSNNPNWYKEIKQGLFAQLDSQLKTDAKELFKFPYVYLNVTNNKYTRKANKQYSHWVSRLLHYHLLIYLQEFYKWHIYIKTIDNEVGFQIPFLFDELDSIYALREMPKTKTGRNKKIIHWVCAHNRKIKIKDVNGDEIGHRDIWIRRFLRGENKFNWNGVKVGIMPSKYDLKRHLGVKRKFNISAVK